MKLRINTIGERASSGDNSEKTHTHLHTMRADKDRCRIIAPSHIMLLGTVLSSNELMCDFIATQCTQFSYNNLVC
jgi:hypothetical protein